MKFLFLFLLLPSFSAFSNVDVSVGLDLNGKSVIIQNTGLAFDKEVTTLKNDFKIKYSVSRKIPNDIPAADLNNNQKSILFNISISKNNEEIISNVKAVTLYGIPATLETNQQNENLKIKLTATESLEEMNKRISSIKRFPVYTESVFLVNYQPIENVKSELEKIMSSNGKIRIDKNTNSIIVKDTLEKIIEINRKFETVDI
jgi:hypothetical protein